MDRDARRRHAQSALPATWGRGRAVRLARESYDEDIPVHLTICADAGRPFEVEAVARMVCDSIEQASRMLAFELYCYCLMPDHLHLLVSPSRSKKNVSAFLDRFKSFTTNQYWKLGSAGRLWQPSARDRVKRENEPLQTLVAYIANNPVRAGLVECWSEWPYTRVFVEV